MTKTIKQILTEARGLIANPSRWTQSVYAVGPDGRSVPPTSPDACAWCAYGALDHFGGNGGLGAKQEAERALNRASELMFGAGVVTVNDGCNGAGAERGQAHANILAVFDRAIADCVEA